MVKLIFTTIFFSCLFSKTYSIEDPPMFYIHNFSSQKEVKNSSFTYNLVPSIITTEISKFPQIKIAGETIQERVGGKDKVMNILRSYKYPENTDYIIVSEIHSISNQSFEIDIRVMDVSLQEVFDSVSISVRSGFIRTDLESKLNLIVQKLLAPFTGMIFFRVDSFNRDKIIWNRIYMRPEKIFSNGSVVKTSAKDFQLQRVARLGNDQQRSIVFDGYYDVIENVQTNNLAVLLNQNSSNKLLLPGRYIIQVQLKNNKEVFETQINLKKGFMNEVYIDIPFEIEEGEPTGDITISNIQDNMEIQISSLGNLNSAIFLKKDKRLMVISNGIEGDLFTTNSSIRIESADVGSYSVSATSLSNSYFPGKHYANLFSYKKEKKLKNDSSIKFKLPDSDQSKDNEGMEIIIYFNPFNPEENESYSIYFNDDKEPKSKIKSAGELHIFGVDATKVKSIKVERKGYIPAVLEIYPVKDKLYLMADLSNPL